MLKLQNLILLLFQNYTLPSLQKAKQGTSPFLGPTCCYKETKLLHLAHLLDCMSEVDISKAFSSAVAVT